MDTSLRTTMTLLVRDEHCTSKCLSVETDVALADPDPGQSESAALALELSMLLMFGPDHIVLRDPNRARPQARPLGGNAPPVPAELRLRFGVSLVDLNLKLAGMYSPPKRRSHQNSMDLAAEMELQHRSGRAREHRAGDEVSLGAGIKNLLPSVQASAKATTRGTESDTDDDTQKTTRRQVDVFTYGSRHNPHWEIKSNSGHPLERNIECKTVLELSNSATESEIEATTDVDQITIVAKVIGPEPALSKQDAWIAKAIYNRLSKGLLYRATLCPA